MDSTHLLQEFDKVAGFVTLKDGFGYHTLREINNRFSLSVTNLLQRCGVNRSLGARRGERLVMNIGCGSESIAGYVNVDLFPSLTRFLRCLAGRDRLKTRYFLNLCLHDPRLDGVADGIVLSHVLEHIPPALVPVALANCHRYLKPGGVVRISVPYIEAYSRLDDAFPPDQGVRHPLLAKNQLVYGWFHRFMYDSEILCALLARAGYRDVREVEYGQGALAEGDIAARRVESIYCTAVK